MRLIYDIIIRGYCLLIRLAALKNQKAKRWLDGRKGIFSVMKKAICSDHDICWVHSSSSGEFEQGRVFIDTIKKFYPDLKILVTFFSPSGYDVKKDYEHVDYAFYLPADTLANAKQFIDIVKPKYVFFVKYEFWYHFLTQLKVRGIPTYLFSAIFRPSNLFFKPWGKWYRKALEAFSYIYVQNMESLSLLRSIGFDNVMVVGDTRFDRVGQVTDASSSLQKMEVFCEGKKVIVAGSTWQTEDKMVTKYINNTGGEEKFVIAPHEISKKSIERISKQLSVSYTLFSIADNADLKRARVLIVDEYGYLMPIYRYGKIAIIGGGFTDGIHNILEAAAFGMPIAFGPNYRKFQEAHDLIDLEAAFCVKNFNDMESFLGRFLKNPQYIEDVSQITRRYIKEHRGATAKMMSHIFHNLSNV